MNDNSSDSFKVRIYDALRQWFGYKEFRSRQYDAINAILCGFDVIVLMPTGGGKSLCYQIPPLVKKGICVVISPLIALMQDQRKELNERKIPCAYLSSSQSSTEYRSILAQLHQPECPFKLLYITPERLQVPDFMSILQDLQKRNQLDLIAIDEAHCISTWGHDFRSAYRCLSSLRELLPDTPIMALSATATNKIVKDIKDQLNIPYAQVISESFNRPNIFYSVINTDNVDKFDKIMELMNKYKDKSIIIYVRKKDDAESLKNFLTKSKITATVYHGSLPNFDKEEALKNWTNNSCRVIVATIAFGMGINKNNVRLVIHWNLPGSLYNYYQESGRAGRDGKPSESVIFYSKDDANCISYTIKRDDDEKRIDRQLDELREVMKYCSENGCRRKAILKYFQETNPKTQPDQCCDYCKNPNLVRRDSAVSHRLPSTQFRIPMPHGINEKETFSFLTAKEVLLQCQNRQQPTASVDCEEIEVSVSRPNTGGMYRVNDIGQFVDVCSEEEEEEEDLLCRLRRKEREKKNMLHPSNTLLRSDSETGRKCDGKTDDSTASIIPTSVIPIINKSIISSPLNRIAIAAPTPASIPIATPTSTSTPTPASSSRISKKRPSSSPSDRSSSLQCAAPQLMSKMLEDVAAIRPFGDVTSRQRQKCVEGLKKKYEIALTWYIPAEWVECVSLQQGRLQEHLILERVSSVPKEKQSDIRSMFGNKSVAEPLIRERCVLKKYKAEYTKIFGVVTNCGKEERTPPFVPIQESRIPDLDIVNDKDLLLMSKCRLSLLPFFPPESIQQITKHIMKTISSNTPTDSRKDDFIQNIHLQIAKSIKKKQPFLLR